MSIMNISIIKNLCKGDVIYLLSTNNKTNNKYLDKLVVVSKSYKYITLESCSCNIYGTSKDRVRFNLITNELMIEDLYNTYNHTFLNLTDISNMDLNNIPCNYKIHEDIKGL